MNYKLAKELKDAGFPQREWGDVYSCEKGHELMMIPYKIRPSMVGIDVGETITCPTLEELIEACGWVSLDPDYSGGWMATERTLSDAKDADKPSRSGKGKTPSEAVAQLWLALNK